jgi:hypothetical protein
MKEITRKRQKDGDILEIFIEDFGYVYFKYIDILKIKSDSSYPYLIRIYKKVYSESINNLQVLDRDLLIAPITISGSNGLMKALKLRIVVNEEIYENEKILPDVKNGSPIFVGGYDASKHEKWQVLKDLGDTMKASYIIDYNKVSHLEWGGAMNITGIPFRIKLELLKLEGKDIKKECKLKDWHEELIYEMSNKLPIYSKLDPKTRDYAFK